MAQTLITEKSVKEALGITSFRNLSKEKIVEFISLIPNIDKDVAVQIINQFPAYSEMAVAMIAQLNTMCDNAIKEAGVSQKDSIAAYKLILSDLGELLKKDNISSEERADITDKMIMIADRISAKDSEFKEFLLNTLKIGAPIIGGALVLGAAILGVNARGTKIPKLKK